MKKIYLLLLLTPFFANISFAQDVLQNGDFETWTDSTHPDGWTHVENVTQESTEIYQGSYSSKQESTGGTKDLGQTITGIIPGHTYILTIHYKVEAGDGTDARIWSKWKSGSTPLPDYADELLGPNNSYLPTNNNEWGEYTVTMTAPSSADKFYFEVRTYKGATVYWDDFSFVHEAPVTPDIAITSPADGKNFNPETSQVTVSLSVSNFNVAQPSGGDGYIVYKLDTEPSENKYDTDDFELTGLTPGSHSVKVELVDNNGASLNPPVTAEVNFTIKSYIVVANLTELRAGTLGEYYEVTGEAFVIGGQENSGILQAFLQDNSAPGNEPAGIMVYDKYHVVTIHPELYDGLTNLKGKLSTYKGTLQIFPRVEPTISSTANSPIDPQVITVTELNDNQENYESELIKIENATIDPGSDTEFQSAKSYDLVVASDTTILRTYFNDLVGSTIPTNTVDVSGISGEYKGTAQIYPRDINDIKEQTSAVVKNDIEGLNIYPNPVDDGTIYINSSNPITKKVFIYSITGKQVFSREVENGQAISIRNLKTGLYLVKVIEENKTAVHKLMVK